MNVVKKMCNNLLILLAALLILSTGSCYFDYEGEYVEWTPVKIAYRTGLTLDGNRDSQYEGVESMTTDASGDDPTSYNGNDYRDVIVVEDGTYVWIYVDFYDGSPDPSFSNGRGFVFKFIDETEQLWILVEPTWTVGTADPINNTAVAVNNGIELRILKSDFSNRSFLLECRIHSYEGSNFDGTKPQIYSF